MRKIGLIILPVLITGCSSPATEAEIRAAVKECYGVLDDVQSQLQPKRYLRAGSYRTEEAEPVTLNQLNSFLKECKNQKTQNVETKNDAQIIGKQINVLAEIKYENEIKHAKSMAYLDSQSEDNAQ